MSEVVSGASITAEQVLIDAKEVIATEELWCKGLYENNGRHCAVGAIIQAIQQQQYRYGHAECELACVKSLNILRKGFMEVFDDGIGAISYENDKPSTTHVQVIQAFEKAIAIAGEQGK